MIPKYTSNYNRWNLRTLPSTTEKDKNKQLLRTSRAKFRKRERWEISTFWGEVKRVFFIRTRFQIIEFIILEFTFCRALRRFPYIYGKDVKLRNKFLLTLTKWHIYKWEYIFIISIRIYGANVLQRKTEGWDRGKGLFWRLKMIWKIQLSPSPSKDTFRASKS